MTHHHHHEDTSPESPQIARVPFNNNPATIIKQSRRGRRKVWLQFFEVSDELKCRLDSRGKTMQIDINALGISRQSAKTIAVNQRMISGANTIPTSTTPSRPLKFIPSKWSPTLESREYTCNRQKHALPTVNTNTQKEQPRPTSLPQTSTQIHHPITLPSFAELISSLNNGPCISLNSNM